MILSKPFEQGGLVDFDCSTGIVKPAVNVTEKPKGNFHMLGQKKIAIYREGNNLTLQIGGDTWNLSSDDVEVKYSHDFSRKTTCFEVESGGEAAFIEYEAWWSGIPGFEPVEPEMDEDEDFMGYVYAVWKNKSLQNSLIRSWA